MKCTKYNMKQPTQKLVKGVIYDDVCMKEMVDEMFNLLDDLNGVPDKLIAPLSDDVSLRETRDFYKGMDAIAALTRFNFDTGVNHNLIIPKECLSRNLVEELEKVDLGQNLLHMYTDKFNAEHNYSEEEVEPEDFCKDEEEFMNDTIDKYTDTEEKEEGNYFINGKRVSAKEMSEFLNNNPAFSSFLTTKPFSLF